MNMECAHWARLTEPFSTFLDLYRVQTANLPVDVRFTLLKGGMHIHQDWDRVGSTHPSLIPELPDLTYPTGLDVCVCVTVSNNCPSACQLACHLIQHIRTEVRLNKTVHRPDMVHDHQAASATTAANIPLPGSSERHGRDLVRGLAQHLEAGDAHLSPLGGALVFAEDALELAVLAAGHLRMQLVQQLLFALQHLQRQE